MILKMAVNFVVVIVTFLFSIQIYFIVTEAACNKTLAKQLLQEGIDFDALCTKTGRDIQEARDQGKSEPDVPKNDLTERNVTFMLLPTLKPNDARNLTTWNETTLQSVDMNKLFWIHIPGVAGPASEEAEKMRSLLGSINMNLIIVNWDSYSLKFNAFYLVYNTVHKLGEVCAKFVKLLLKYGAKNFKIRMSGASAGGQAVGLCGKRVEPRVDNIIALDPAGPCFKKLNDSYRLAETDANYVSIFHCSNVYGVAPTYNAKADYFLGCGGNYFDECSNETSLNMMGLCSHSACWKYMFPSKDNPHSLVGVHCDNEEQFFNKNCSFFKRQTVGLLSSLEVVGKIYAPIPYPLEPSYNNVPSRWRP